MQVVNTNKTPMMDKSTVVLILTNIFVIFLAVWQSWDFSTLIWVYWFQSVVIGVFVFIKILKLKNFSTKNFYINHRPVKPTKETKVFTAFFFLVHYGIFHLAYLMFLSGSVALVGSQFLMVLFAGAVFFVNHLFSFRRNFEHDVNKKQNIGIVMFRPYARIIPMHLIIVSGAFFAGTGFALVFFLVLKTIADVVMHVLEHR